MTTNKAAITIRSIVWFKTGVSVWLREAAGRDCSEVDDGVVDGCDAVEVADVRREMSKSGIALGLGSIRMGANFTGPKLKLSSLSKIFALIVALSVVPHQLLGASA